MNRMKFLWVALLIAVITALLSLWLRFQTPETSISTQTTARSPDYYLENFSTITMDLDGKPKNKLSAARMLHFADDDSSELTQPKLQLYNIDKPPTLITAEKGWISANNEVILLKGDVYLRQNDAAGLLELQVETTDVLIKAEENYAETDAHATITGASRRIEGVGLRAYMNENRVELLNNVKGKINPRK